MQSRRRLPTFQRNLLLPFVEKRSIRTLKMESTESSEMLATMRQTIRCQISEDSNLQSPSVRISKFSRPILLEECNPLDCEDFDKEFEWKDKVTN
jgi:hypothetical protein